MIDNHPAIRKRRIHYINLDSKILETRVAYFEKLLKQISNVDITELPNLDAFKDCDLLIVNAVNVHSDAFEKWIKQFYSKIKKENALPVPTLFFSNLDFQSLNSLWNFAYKENWYFDILNPKHMDSLPIRVANLLRIHDHIHEIKRYEMELTAIKNKVSALEAKFEKS